MTATGHAHFEELVAGYVLGALSAEDRAELTAHLEVCDDCRADLVSLAPLPALLSRLDVDDVGSPVPTTDIDGLVAVALALGVGAIVSDDEAGRGPFG